MSKYREPKESDQDEAGRVYDLLMELAEKHPNIEPTMWVSVCLSAVAQSFFESGVSYGDYKLEMYEATDFYKSLWDETLLTDNQ